MSKFSQVNVERLSTTTAEWRERAETAERYRAQERIEWKRVLDRERAENRKLRDALALAAERVRLAHVRQPCQAGDCGICAHLAEWAALAATEDAPPERDETQIIREWSAKRIAAEQARDRAALAATEEPE